MRILIALLFLWLPTISAAQDVRTYIPTRAQEYLPIVKSEQRRLMPELSTPHYFGALIEHESCISLKHSRCWSPVSELKTQREQGVGFFQITRAYKKDGSLRFDTLSDLRKKYLTELKDLSWENIKTKPDLQIRAGMLLVKDNYRSLSKVPDSDNRLAMSDAAYNGGMGNVNKARKACGLAKGCDPNLWFGHVEKYMPQSRALLYGKRSAYDIVTHHVKDTMTVRLTKYKPFLY